MKAFYQLSVGSDHTMTHSHQTEDAIEPTLSLLACTTVAVSFLQASTTAIELDQIILMKQISLCLLTRKLN